MVPPALLAVLLLPATAGASGASSPLGAGSALGAGTGNASAAGAYAAWGCEGGWGRCRNAGARDGVMCDGGQGLMGYFCPAEPSATGDSTFACLDWTFGSRAMQAAEASFNQRANQSVFFGVGTYGVDDDPQQGLGACYRLRAEGVHRDIIAQSLNTGHDVAGNQFDLQLGAGGMGFFNSCAGSGASMFPGSLGSWGRQYGGVLSRRECDHLPEYPHDGQAMRQAGDSLVALCRIGFDARVRLSSARGKACNPTLLDVARVRCPEELVSITQMQRRDEPQGYDLVAAWRPVGFPNTDGAHECNNQQPGVGAEYCVSRMMDCRKPSGADVDNVQPELMMPGRLVAQTCTRDGYARVNVQCGCFGCYC